MNDLDWLINAIADSLHMKPYRWIAKYGAGTAGRSLPPEHSHLLKDYKQTYKEITEG